MCKLLQKSKISPTSYDCSRPSFYCDKEEPKLADFIPISKMSISISTQNLTFCAIYKYILFIEISDMIIFCTMYTIHCIAMQESIL